MPTRMDSMLSHGMGRVKAMKARLKGLVGVFKTLSEQHGEVFALLERARTSEDKFRELWPELKRELRAHEHAELREIYPELRKYETTRSLAAHHDAEAADLDLQIARIDELVEAGGDARKAAYKRLIDMVSHHAKEEENVIFPKAQAAIGKARAEELVEKFLLTKKQLASAF